MAAPRRTREQRGCSPPHGFTSAVHGLTFRGSFAIIPDGGATSTPGTTTLFAATWLHPRASMALLPAKALPSSLMAALRRTREQRRCSPPHGFTSAVQGNNDKALSVPDDHLGPPSGKVHGPGMLRCNIAGLPAAKAAAPVPLPCAMECLREAP